MKKEGGRKEKRKEGRQNLKTEKKREGDSEFGTTHTAFTHRDTTAHFSARATRTWRGATPHLPRTAHFLHCAHQKAAFSLRAALFLW